MLQQTGRAAPLAPVPVPAQDLVGDPIAPDSSPAAPDNDPTRFK
jgi:DnaA family protein